MADGENMADLFVPSKSLQLVTPWDPGLLRQALTFRGLAPSLG